MFLSRALRTGAVDAAGTVNITIEESALGARNAVLYGSFVYGSGGTSVKCYLEGSYDQGTTWIPVANMTFALASGQKLLSIVPVTIASTSVAGTQADDAALSHLPPRLRVRVVTTGTYSGSTLGLYFHLVG